MSTVREHPWQDMTCTVEAGCTWQAMQTATGILTGSLLGSTSPHRLTGLRARLEAAGGSLTMLHAPLETDFDRWGTLPGSFPLMRAVKQQFDPRGILNPVRFLGEI